MEKYYSFCFTCLDCKLILLPCLSQTRSLAVIVIALEMSGKKNEKTSGLLICCVILISQSRICVLMKLPTNL